MSDYQDFDYSNYEFVSDLNNDQKSDCWTVCLIRRATQSTIRIKVKAMNKQEAEQNALNLMGTMWRVVMIY